MDMDKQLSDPLGLGRKPILVVVGPRKFKFIPENKEKAANGATAEVRNQKVESSSVICPKNGDSTK